MKATDRFRSVEPRDLNEWLLSLTPGETILCAISPEEYHRRPEISSGFVRSMKSEGPLQAHARFIARSEADEDNASMQLGRIVHRALADPEGWAKNMRIMPESLQDGDELDALRKKWRGRSKADLRPGDMISSMIPAHREWLAGFTADKSVEWVDQGDYDKAMGIVASVSANPATAVLVGNPAIDCEVIGFHKDQATGLILKAMADCLWLAESLVCDFKTTSLSTLEKFIRFALRDYGIDIQLAHYCRVFQVQNAAVISLRNQRPYESAWMDLPEFGLRQATAALDGSLRKIDECLQFGNWNSDGFGTRLSLVLE